MGVSYVFRAHEGDSGVAVEEFTDEEAGILDASLTNVADNIFAWKLGTDLTPEQAGALLSRYSRTALTSKRLFLKEFYPNKNRGREFFDAWLVDYGDDSIQEMAGGLPVSCEFVSNLAVKDIEDCRLGSYIEKSTRYVAFDKKLPNNEFMFYKDKEIMDSRYGDDYTKLMNGLFTSYSGHMDAMSKYIRDTNPIDNISFRLGDRLVKISEIKNGADEKTGVTEAELIKAYDNSIKANALDFLRDYLPMSLLTHVGMSMGSRSYENMLNKMLASPLRESRWIATRVTGELSKLVPSLVKRIDDSHGKGMQQFMSDRTLRTMQLVEKATKGIVSGGEDVSIDYYTGMGSGDPDLYAQKSIAAAVLYRFSHGLSMSNALSMAEKMPVDERKTLISTYVGERKNRRHKPGRAFEDVEYLFDLKGRIGIYRDIQRHRIGTQERQNFGTELGYDTRDAYADIGIEDDYKSLMRDVDSLYKNLLPALPYQAQYVVTFGFNIRWYYRLNARQLYHLCELRSSTQGHPDYRRLVQHMAMKTKAIHPTVVEQMSYLDMNEKTLGRLDSEIRIAVKKSALKA
ncbi:MAG TPA: FAD-dependent thymidylate synthase [Candidatus Acidoferrales bacterium]|nr:FAD-dependent thymidylate synthase [Candidatus Acidoferrales bacterium]